VGVLGIPLTILILTQVPTSPILILSLAAHGFGIFVMASYPTDPKFLIIPTSVISTPLTYLV